MLLIQQCARNLCFEAESARRVSLGFCSKKGGWTPDDSSGRAAETCRGGLIISIFLIHINFAFERDI
ncbi:hypothetical protein ASE23_25620 [Rhizobium sp. Root73]|nr:hypothetical protein ASE23_25620 [Rhizobium sp. Root73]